MALHGDDDRPLTLAVHATPKGVPPAELEATSPLSLRTLLRRRPDAATLARTPFEINGHVAKVPLTMLRKMLGEPMSVPAFSAGTLSLQLAARGSAVDPTGTLAIDLTGVTHGAHPRHRRAGRAEGRSEDHRGQRPGGAPRTPAAGAGGALRRRAGGARGSESARRRSASPARGHRSAGNEAPRPAGRSRRQRAERRAATGPCTPISPSTARCARRASRPTCRPAT